MSYFKVKGWDKYQAYKDGRPIHWIKVHLKLLDDYEYNQLPEISQLHLAKIWLLAGRMNNKVPLDESFVSQSIRAKSNVDLDQLVTAGFLVPYETVRNRTKSYLEERRVEKKENTSKPAVPTCPHQKIIEAYHQILPERPTVLIARWKGSQSERNLQARWRENGEHQAIDWWRGFFASVRTNDWWMGRDKWKGVDLHWLLKRNNFDKAVQHWSNAA